MDLAQRLSLFSAADYAAVGALVLSYAVLGWLVDHPLRVLPSTAEIMSEYRRDWMRQLVTRQQRIFDGSIIENLRQGTAFFASATMIAIGGGVALVGNADRLAGLARDLTLPSDGLVVQIKILVVLAFVANALLKFVWAHRLFGYCAVLMAAVPNDPDDPVAYHRAAQAAEVNITAARGFNRGIRIIHFALAALAWLLGPWALLAATALTVGVLVRREFASHSRQVILDRGA